MLTDLEQEMLDLVNEEGMIRHPSRKKPGVERPQDAWERLGALKFLVSLGLIDWDVDFPNMEYVFFKNGTMNRHRAERSDVLDAAILYVEG